MAAPCCPPCASPSFLPPATPSELLERLLEGHRHPTTLVVGWPRQQFLDGLADDVRGHAPPAAPNRHPFFEPPPLARVAVARHLRVAFVPTLTHLRSYLAAFFATDADAPPTPQGLAPSSPSPPPPLLLVYGFLELHRDGGQWSAQALNTSAAGLVETAARNGLRAAIVEPRKTQSGDELRSTLSEEVPVLSGSTMGDDGTWRGRRVSVQRVLGRWFECNQPDDNHAPPGPEPRNASSIVIPNLQ